MTAYRQRALACAAELAQGPRRPRDLKSSIPDGPEILHGNVYGWFAPVERGVYSLTESGRAALMRWPQLPIATVASKARHLSRHDLAEGVEDRQREEIDGRRWADLGDLERSILRSRRRLG